MVTIAPLSIDKLEGFRSVVDAVARERRYLATLEGFPAEQVREYVEALRRDRGVQLVALDGDRVIGWCDIRRLVSEGFRHTGTLGIGLLSQYRDQGLGRRLLDRTIDAAFAANMTRIELEVFASNARARYFFESAGFVTEGIKRRARILDGEADDVVCMARLR